MQFADLPTLRLIENKKKEEEKRKERMMRRKASDFPPLGGEAFTMGKVIKQGKDLGRSIYPDAPYNLPFIFLDIPIYLKSLEDKAVSPYSLFTHFSQPT